ncbi:MAG: hypothetical protein OWT28_02850 [Firmicutes bacterium]|nr:hypothetical protein [Bacillota bacterium]
MERKIKDWMFVSIALLFAEIGRLLGGDFHWHMAEHTLDGVAILLLLVMIARYIAIKWRR